MICRTLIYDDRIFAFRKNGESGLFQIRNGRCRPFIPAALHIEIIAFRILQADDLIAAEFQIVVVKNVYRIPVRNMRQAAVPPSIDLKFSGGQRPAGRACIH